MAGNSTVTIQSVVDYARTMPDLQPTLAVGGFAQQPALTIANDTITSMLSPGMPWKFNRFLLPVFYTNQLQQDYALNVVNLGWLENGYLVDINNTGVPVPIWPVEIVRDVPATSWASGRIGQCNWLPNDQLVYGTWKANTTYQQILGTPSNPGTSTLQITDSNGNLWIVSNNVNATVTTGSSYPAFPQTPVYPTYSNPSVLPSFVSDGSVIWMAVGPKSQGIRTNPLPAAGSLYYQVNLVGQMRPPVFTSMTQTIEPIPDDYSAYFRSGFIAHAYRHSKDKDIRAKFQDEFGLWRASMQEALSKSAREREEAGFYPFEGLMTNGYPLYVGPANPWWPGGF